MFRKLIEWLTKDRSQSKLEAYIVSKNPSSAAEVDYWAREYDKNVWARGL